MREDVLQHERKWRRTCGHARGRAAARAEALGDPSSVYLLNIMYQ
jgi:hypothetical protein